MISDTKFFNMLLNRSPVRTITDEGEHGVRASRKQPRKHINQKRLILLWHETSNMTNQERIIRNAELFTCLFTRFSIKTEFIQFDSIGNHGKIRIFAE
ncbi:hypothetical protein NRBB04_0402 [Bifidobacterium breve]|nr:hypothetical protein NRBB04_0402 [Bifidobacterium breve]